MVKSLAKSGASALLILLLSLCIYALTRGLVLLSSMDYSTYEPEFSDVPRDFIGWCWVVTGLLIGYSIVCGCMYAWRLSLLLCSLNFGLWSMLLIANHSYQIFDGAMTYMFLAVCCFAIAIRADDPRPLKLLKEQFNDNRTSSTNNSAD